MKKASKQGDIRELAEELDIFDEMLSVLMELLESKGIITQKEFETKLRDRIKKISKNKSYRSIELGKSRRKIV